MKAMVLAAGVGSRLEPLTTQVPKPLVPVANVPVMDHIIRLLNKHGFDDICANLHYLPEQMIEYFGDGSQHGVRLHFRHEEKLTGDAGGVRACKQFLQDGTFIVINGDLLTDADLSLIVKEHKEKKALASIAVKALDDVTRFGVVVTDKNGFVTGFQEKPQRHEALSNLISTGIYVLEPEIFNYIPESGEYGFGRQLFPTLLQNKLPVLGIEVECYWSDVGTLQQYSESNFDALSDLVHVDLPGRKHREGNTTFWLGAGSTIDPTCEHNGLVMLGKNSHVRERTNLSGTVVIGDNVTIESGAQITDSVIWSGARIGAKSQIRNSVIGLNCSVNPNTIHNQVTQVEDGSAAVAVT